MKKIYTVIASLFFVFFLGFSRGKNKEEEKNNKEKSSILELEKKELIKNNEIIKNSNNRKFDFYSQFLLHEGKHKNRKHK